MARDLITELFDRFGKEGNYGYKKFEIGVYLPNVIGFNEESKKYVSKIADPYGELDPITRERSYSFLNKFKEEKFKIILEDIRVVETDLADSDKAVLFTGTYDNKEGRKYQYIDQNIAAKNGSFYINDSLYIGATQDAITLDDDGAPIVDETKADYIFKQPSESDSYGVIFKNDLKVNANIYNTGNITSDSNIEVKHSATFGSADSEDDLFKVISSAKFDKYVNIADKYEFKNSEDGAIFHEKVTLDKNLIVDGDTILNKNLDVKKNITAVYDTASNSYRIIANNDENVFIVNFADNKFSGNLNIDGDTVIGKAGLSTLLTINSATAIKSTLSVTGETILKDNLQVDKNANIDGTLSVTGVTTLKSTLGVTGNTTIGGTLGVTGATTLKDTLSVAQLATFNNGITVKGTANIEGISISGDATLDHLIVLNTSIFNGSITAKEAVTLNKTLNVDGDTIIGKEGATTSLTVNSATTLNDILKVVKKATFNDSIQVDKNANIDGTLSVTGVTTLKDNLTVGTDTSTKTVTVHGSLLSDNGTFKNLTVSNPNADGTNSATATIYNLLSYDSTFSGTKTTINSTQLSISSSTVDIDPYINMSSNLITIKKPISIINSSSISSNGALSLDGNVSLFKSTNNYLFRLSSDGLYSDFSTNIFGGNILPKTDVAHNLGSATNRWNNIYVNTINGSTFTGNAASATKLLNARTITIKGVQLASPTKTSNSVSTTFNGTSNIEFDISGLGYDASKIISGIIDIERLPKGALDRLLIVDDKNARLALTKDDVQYGDTVQEDNTKLMYYVCDESKLGTSEAENAFREYTVGHATAVPWSGVENKPDWILNPRYLTINREGESNSVINYTSADENVQSQTLNIKKLDIILAGGLHSTKSTTTYNTGTTKSVTITPASIGAAPEEGSTDIKTLASTITLGNGDSNASIDQNNGTYRQRISIIDNSTSGDGVFEFSQSSDSGATYKSLMRIDDDGTVRANKFVGDIEGNVTGKADTAGVADKLTTSSVGSNTKFMYLNNGVATASTGTVASATQLMYLNAGTFTASTANVSNDGISLMGLVNGILTKSTKTVASSTQLMYLNAGTLTASTSTIGSTDSPVYLSNGIITTTGNKFSDYFKRSGSVITNPNTSLFSISNTVDGYLLFSDTGNTSGVARGIGGVNGSNDGWTVRGYQTGENVGALEISVGDDGDEGIYVRQYISAGYKLPFMNDVGAEGTSYRETILMEPITGDAKFYRKVYANGTNGGFVGDLSGTATIAQYLITPNVAGYSTDEYGNIHPKSTITDSNCWVWYNNSGTDKTKYYWNSGNIEFTGKITGNGGLKTTAAEVTGNTKTNTATIGDNVTLQYNSSTESLDFVFS